MAHMAPVIAQRPSKTSAGRRSSTTGRSAARRSAARRSCARAAVRRRSTAARERADEITRGARPRVARRARCRSAASATSRRRSSACARPRRSTPPSSSRSRRRASRSRGCAPTCASTPTVAPRLAARGEAIADLGHVFHPILEAFDADGKLVDHASDALGPLRRALASIKAQLEKRMEQPAHRRAVRAVPAGQVLHAARGSLRAAGAHRRQGLRARHRPRHVAERGRRCSSSPRRSSSSTTA